VEKKLFNDGGEWFFRQTVIDVPATTAITFIGEQGTTERVVWDIQEQFLFAYRAYPFMEGGDGHVRPGTGPYTDAPVAAFRILSHFDVQRQYNPATGEQSNVLVENMMDRPWYERDYMRVDWANNLISDFSFSASAVTQAPVTFYNGEDATHETKDAVQLGEDYIDVVQTITAQPELNQLYTQYFGMPVLECWLYTSIHTDCKGAQLKVRNSFMRAPETSDYQVLDFDDRRFAKFGYFRAERYDYNAEYGIVEPGVQRMANRFNLWTDAESCYDAEAVHPFGACSPDQLKTVVYYLNEDFPEEFKSYAIDNGTEWNRLFTDAVLQSTGWDESAMDGVRMYTICPNNPVQAGDPAECGTRGLNPQIGDLRYSMYYYVPDQQEWSPLGYGPSAQDPLTGETIQGNAFYYGAAGKRVAARTRDIIEQMLGIVDLEDLAGGYPARTAIQNVQARENARFRELNENFDKERITQLVDKLQIREKGMRLNHQIETGEAFMDLREGRLEKLENSPIDEMLMTNTMQDELRGLQMGEELADGSMDMQGIRSVEKLLGTDMFAYFKARESRLLTPKAGGCILVADEAFDAGLVGMMNTVTREFYNMNTDPPQLKEGKTREDVYDFIVGRTMADTQLHEIGHTVGLRHNFSGSTDALNFGADYWRLRGPGYTMGASDKRPRPLWDLAGPFLDGYDQALREGLMDAQDSTVMDYASTYGTNTKLGMYDLAAIKYAYFDTVEVFNSPDINKDRAELLRMGELHYTYYPEVVSNGATYDERVAAMYDRRSVNWRLTDTKEDIYDENLVEVPYSFCSDEYREASATCYTWDSGADNFERSWKMAQDYRNYMVFDAFKRERVNFGIDLMSYLSRVYGRKYTYLLNQYKNWVNDELIIRRDDACVWYEDGQLQESGDRFAADACGLAGFLGASTALNLFGEVLQTPDVGCYARLKPGCYEVDATNDHGIDGTPVRLLDANPNACDGLVPTQGEDPTRALKVTDTTAYRHVPDSLSCEGFEPIVAEVTGDVVTDEPLDLGYGDARSQITTYDRDEYGYYFYWKPTQMGSWWDKWLAVKAMGDPTTDFIGVDSSSDTRSFMISLNTLFGDDINDLVGGIITEDSAKYGARVNSTRDGVEFLDVLALTGGFDRSTNDRPYIDPDQQYTFRLLAMFDAAYQVQQTDDMDFSESLAVDRRYNNTEADLPAELMNDPDRYTEFRDPETGFVYFAIRQARDAQDGEGVYSTGYEFVRDIKDKYFVGGAAGPGEEIKEGFFAWQLQSDIRILEIMRETRNVFGRPQVWAWDF
jgi:hypothetical protein